MTKAVIKNLLILCSVLTVTTYANASGVVEKRYTASALERVEVIGEKTADFYLGLMQRAELDFYKQLNKQLANHEFKISCHKENNFGNEGTTKIRRKYCLPNYVRDRMASETQRVISAAIQPQTLGLILRPKPTLEHIETLTADKRKQAELAIAEVLEANPELQSLLIKLNQAQHNYETLSKLNK